MLTAIEGYLASLPARSNATPDTIRTYRNRLLQFLRWLGERHGETVAAFARIDAVDYINHLQASGKRPRTIRPAFSSIRGLAVWMQEQGLEAPDLSGLKAPRLDAPKRYTPTDEEMLGFQRALEQLPDFTLRQRFDRGRSLVILYITACTAIRHAELTGLRVADVQLDPRPNESVLTVREGKGRKSRRIPINDEAKATLEAWLAVRAEWADVKPARAKNEWLLPVDSRRGISSKSITHVVDMLNHLAPAAERVTLHCIRHWSASRMASVPGVNLASIAEILGHSCIQTTQRYIHGSEKQKKAAVAGVSLSGDVRPAECREEVGSQDSTSRRATLIRMRRAAPVRRPVALTRG